MNKIIHGKVRKCKFIPLDPSAFRLQFAKHEGHDVEVVIRRKKKHRSGQQNAYLWGCVYDLISAETGYSPQETHDAMRFKFLTDLSKDIPVVKSTTSLTTVEFMDYIAEIQKWASEFLDVFIPEPNEVEY